MLQSGEMTNLGTIPKLGHLHVNETNKSARLTKLEILMIRFVHPLSLDKVLFGGPNISMGENISLFKAVHQYIKDTSRFSIS